MMNKKGFTVLELILAFSLMTIVVVYLLQIIALVQSVYIRNNSKSELLIKQNNVIDLMYRDLDAKGLKAISSCGTNCYELTFNNSENKKIEKYTDGDKSIVKYGNYAVEYDSRVKVGNIDRVQPSIFTPDDGIIGTNFYNAILEINIPVSDQTGVYSIQVVYQYNTTINNVTVS